MTLLHTAKSWRLGLLLPAALIAATLSTPGQAQQANPIPAALSQTDSATHAEKLVLGRAVQNALEACVLDIEQNDLRLTEDNRRLEYQLGLLRTSESQLQPEISDANTAVSLSFIELHNARAEVRIVRDQANYLQAYRAAIQREMDQCKRDWAAFICDFAKELSGVRAKEDQLNADIAEIDRRIRIKQADMASADLRLNDANSRMVALQAQISQLDAEIDQIEPQIVRNKAILATARSNYQTARSTVDDLDALLRDVQAFDAGVEPITRSRMTSLSVAIDQLMGSTPRILADARGVLPPGDPGCVGF